MCCGALYWSKIGKIVWGASDEKNGFSKTAGNNNPFHPKTTIVKGILATETAQLMKRFFRPEGKFTPLLIFSSTASNPA
jgi:tRNA(adenine34) deaminase